MTAVKYLLIGGGMASYHAAKQIRRSDPEGSVLIATDEAVPPYDRPPLSKECLLGKKSTAELIYETAEALADQGVSLSLGSRVERLDPAASTAWLANGTPIEFQKALLATGGRPIALSVPGAAQAALHYLRTAADADAISMQARPGRRVVVIGAGFIGLEVAASLRQRGLEVTVIEALPRVWARFASEGLSNQVEHYLGERDITILTSTAVAEVRRESGGNAVVTSSGAVLECDFICVGVGIVPNTELAGAAGLLVDNGIVVDETLRTSHPDVYAAGDVINYPDQHSGRRRRVEHWGHAEYSGQIAGSNMTGGNRAYDFLSYVWSDLFDLRLEFAGDESQHDAILQRGEFGEPGFSVLYLQQGRLTAYFGVNLGSREMGALRRLIQTRKDLSGRDSDLQDVGFNLRQLV